MCCGAVASHCSTTQHDMLPQHLVCKYELNCKYCNITLARNKAPWWWSDKIETCRSVLKVFYMKLYVHSLVDKLKWRREILRLQAIILPLGGGSNRSSCRSKCYTWLQCTSLTLTVLRHKSCLQQEQHKPNSLFTQWKAKASRTLKTVQQNRKSKEHCESEASALGATVDRRVRWASPTDTASVAVVGRT